MAPRKQKHKRKESAAQAAGQTAAAALSPTSRGKRRRPPAGGVDEVAAPARFVPCGLRDRALAVEDGHIAHHPGGGGGGNRGDAERIAFLSLTAEPAESAGAAARFVFSTAFRPQSPPFERFLFVAPCTAHEFESFYFGERGDDVEQQEQQAAAANFLAVPLPLAAESCVAALDHRRSLLTLTARFADGRCEARRATFPCDELRPRGGDRPEDPGRLRCSSGSDSSGVFVVGVSLFAVDDRITLLE